MENVCYRFYIAKSKFTTFLQDNVWKGHETTWGWFFVGKGRVSSQTFSVLKNPVEAPPGYASTPWNTNVRSCTMAPGSSFRVRDWWGRWSHCGVNYGNLRFSCTLDHFFGVESVWKIMVNLWKCIVKMIKTQWMAQKSFQRVVRMGGNLNFNIFPKLRDGRWTLPEKHAIATDPSSVDIEIVDWWSSTWREFDVLPDFVD